MASDAVESTVERGDDILDTDIVFDCPHCGKSLAIDFRGAGLTIPCTDCGNQVEVPIPEGMELEDIDSSDAEHVARLMRLRTALGEAQSRIRELESRLGDATEVRADRDRLRQAAAARLEALRREMGVVDAAVEQMQRALQRLKDLAAGDL